MDTDEIARIVLLDIAIVVVVARPMGGAFRRMQQPAVWGGDCRRPDAWPESARAAPGLPA